MPRPRKVVEMQTAKMGKRERVNRARQQDELHIDRATIEDSPPDFLDEVAAEEFQRVVREAAKISLFDNLDLTVLAAYAGAYSQMVEAYKHLNAEGMTYKRGNMEYPSPWVTVADKAANTVLKCSGKLGLACTDRLKLIVPTKEEAAVNKFVKYLPSGAGA